MKKILPFLLFFPLLIVSIYIGYSQFKNKGSINTMNTMNNEGKITTNVTNIPQSPDKAQMSTLSPTPQTVQNVDQINLSISSPISGMITDNNTVIVMGSTEPNASVSINDAEVIANKDGSFKTSVALDEGENYISIVAYNDSGEVAEREIVITRTIAGI